MLTAKGKYGMGWLPDYPDFRDYTEGHEEVNKVIAPIWFLIWMAFGMNERVWCQNILRR